MLAGIHRGDRQIGVRIMRHRNHHEVEIALGKQLIRTTEALHAGADILRDTLERFRIDVAQRSQFHRRHLLQTHCVRGAHVTDTNYCNLNLFH